nr:immunoglobulin light chain junction region [Mus musculus]NSM03117.1 immunoglobulin light chain junction region [Mus musculus]NSM03127.1 immunoglobulin light chain junction region [Mus musculus]NSM03267.1 immunoglobulin light chain junction region [Mus musculus]NSM03323.1 immunoglobulin light chain junction region [Mus musculus]
CTLWYNNHWVF